MEEVIAVCQGHKKQTNYLRVLISELAKGMLPASWNRYTVPKSLTVITWMQDFSDRIKQLQKLSDAGNSQGPIGFKSIPVRRRKTEEKHVEITRGKQVQYV